MLGLRWSDIDLEARTVTVNQARILVDYRITVEEPKSENGKRTLPIDNELASALRMLKMRQARERDDAGDAYGSTLAGDGWSPMPGEEYVVTDELGVPVHPDWYSDEFGRQLKRAGLPKIRLHDSRHTTLSLMEKAGVPISIVSKWAGHCDAAFTYRTYVHASEDDLKVGSAALGQLHMLVDNNCESL